MNAIHTFGRSMRLLGHLISLDVRENRREAIKVAATAAGGSLAAGIPGAVFHDPLLAVGAIAAFTGMEAATVATFAIGRAAQRVEELRQTGGLDPVLRSLFGPGRPE